MILFYYVKAILQQRFLTSMSRKKFLKWQEKKIQKHLSQVSKYSFYENYSPIKSLKDLPILDKKNYIKNFHKLNVLDMDFLEAKKIASSKHNTIKHKGKTYTLGLSTGTSGFQSVFITTKKEQHQWAGTLLAKMRVNLFKKNKIAFFLKSNNQLYESLNTPTISFKFFELEMLNKKRFNELSNFNPSIIVAPASMLQRIQQSNTKKLIKPKRIINVAEVLDTHTKDKLESHFGVKIEQVYQATEGSIGFTDKNNALLLNEDLIHVEKKWLDKKRFTPIITDFTRSTQCITRYVMNDILVIDDSYSHDLPFTSITTIEGRVSDIFLLSNKKSKQVKIFPHQLQSIMPKELDDYILELYKKNSLRVHLHKESSIMKEQVKKILKKFFEDQHIQASLTFKTTLIRQVKEKRRHVINTSNHRL